MADLADLPLAEVMRRVASGEPTPGAGPSLAWTCALVAALVEMVSGVSLGASGSGSGSADAIAERGQRAAALRQTALGLAAGDAAAYREVLLAQRDRQQPDRASRVREALQAAADPLVSIVEAAGELSRMAADAAADARGGVRGEARTAAVLGAAVVEAGVSLVELNLAGAPDDPRLARVRTIARQAFVDRDRSALASRT